MNYAPIRTQVVKRPTGLAIYVRTPRSLGRGLGDDSGPVLPTFNPVTPGALPASIDVTSLFTPSEIPVFNPSAPTESGILPSFYPLGSGGAIITPGSVLAALSVPPPGTTPQSALQNVAKTIASGAGSLTGVIFPKAQAAPTTRQASAFGGVSNFLAQSSGVAGLSNQALIGGALGLGIVVMLLRRRR